MGMPKLELTYIDVSNNMNDVSTQVVIEYDGKEYETWIDLMKELQKNDCLELYVDGKRVK